MNLMRRTIGKRRVLCLLLALLILLSAVPAMADNALGSELLKQIEENDKKYNYFEVFAEYGEPDDEGYLPAEIRISLKQGTESEKAVSAKGVVIYVEGQDGLEILSGGGYHLPDYDMTVDESITLHLKLFYNDRKHSGFDEGGELRIPEPTLIVTAYANNTQKTTYTCRFDGTTVPRAMVMGWKMDGGFYNDIALENDYDMMIRAFGMSHYNGRRTAVMGRMEREFWGILEEMRGWETDGNDVTYIYINAHGPYDSLSDSDIISAINKAAGNIRYIPGFKAVSDSEYVAVVDGVSYRENVVLYADMYKKLQEILEGRVVIIIEACYSGQAIDDALHFGVVDDGYTVITAAPRDKESDVGTYIVDWMYDYPTEYGVFTKKMTDYFESSSEPLYATGLMEYIRNDKKENPISYIGRTLDPQIITFEDEVVFCASKDKWIKDPELVVKEELIDVDMGWPRIYYAYLREEIVPEIGLAANEVNGVLGENAYFWNEHNPELSGLLSAAVCDFDMDELPELMTVSVTPRRPEETDEACYSMDLTLYRYEKGEVVETDRFENAVEMIGEHRNIYLSSASVSVTEYEGEVDLYVASSFTPVSPLNYDYSEGRYLHFDIKDGKFIETEGRPRGLNYYTLEGEPFSASEPRTMSYDAEYLLRMKYRRDNGLKNQSVEYLNEIDPCFYEAGDLTHLREYINGMMEPDYFELIRLTSKDEFKSEFEQASEANSFAVKAAVGTLADECGVNVYTNEDTLLIDEIKIYAPEQWGRDDERLQQLQQAYLAIISLDGLGLTEAEYAELAKYEMADRSTMEMGNMMVDCLFVPGDMIIIIDLDTHN